MLRLAAVAPAVLRAGRQPRRLLIGKGQRALLSSAAAASPSTEPPVDPTTTAVPRLPRRANKPRLVILGTGWSSFALAKHINTQAYDVVVVSPRTSMLFTPLLASTAVGTLEFRSVAEPLRYSVRDVAFQRAKCISVDTDQRVARVRAQRSDTSTMAGAAPGSDLADVDSPDWSELDIEYDVLAIGVGAKNNTFGIPGVAEHAHFLKELSDARGIRRTILRNIETASFAGTTAEERRRLLSFVVVGGGPTGIEFSAELHDLVYQDLWKIYPEVVQDIRITVIEAREVLSAFDEKLREFCKRKFSRDKISILTGSAVANVTDDAVILGDGRTIPYGLLVWSTGIMPRQLVSKRLGGEFRKDASGHIVVDGALRAERPGPRTGTTPPAVIPGVFAMGDCASVEGLRLAATAQVAEQQGLYLAHALNAHPEWAVARGALSVGLPGPAPFRYRHRGTLAYIGNFMGLSDFTKSDEELVQGRTVKGLAAWIVWRSAYLTSLGSWRNRMQVPFDWMKAFFFGRDTTLF